MKLFDDQELGMSMLRQSFRTGHRTPMFQAATGYGKTVVAGSIIESAQSRGKKVAFIVPKITLVDQASDHFDAIGLDHGVIQADHWRTDYSKKVQIISAQTLIRRKAWDFDLGIVDEAHVMFKGVLDLMKSWDRIPFVGMSATPFTKGLGKHYDDLIIPITIQELIDKDRLCDAEAYGPSQPDMKGVKIQGGDYNQKQAAERADQEGLIADIVNTWSKLAHGKQTICFATNVAHSQHIVSRFVDAGVVAVHIDAYTDSKDRRDAIRDFKSGKVTVLSSVGVLHTGFDAPNAEVAILARPTKSLSLHLQMIGRILRTHHTKIKGLILDHAGNIERLGFHTDPTPDRLDDGTHKETEKEAQEREERLPRACPQCHAMIPANVAACPKCQFVYKKPNTITEEAGELKKLKKANREMTHEQKAEFYGGLKQYELDKGYKKGWAAHKYRNRLGVWPNKYADVPLVPPNAEVKGWIQHENIKNAKRKVA